MTMKQVKSTDYPKKYRFRNICSMMSALFCTVTFFIVWSEFVIDHNQTGHLTGYGNYVMAIGVYLVFYIYFMRFFGAHRIGVDRVANLLAAQVMTIVITDLCELFASLAITGEFRFINEFFIRYLVLCLIQTIACCIGMYIQICIYRKKFPPLQVLEIAGRYENHLAEKVSSRQDKYVVYKTISVDENDDVIKEEINKAEAVLINDVPSEKKNKIAKYCYDINKRMYFTPKISDIITRSSENLNLFDTPLLLSKNQGLTYSQRTVKRAMDIVGSLIGLVIASPFMLITAICIKLEDHGPVFFKQERCTINNKRFMILKFRSMIVDAEKDGKPHPAGENDDRITKTGRIIRACRMDELPQLINILKGDMSIVGPRPERVEHVEKYTNEISEFALRSKVKGGLTGYAQVYGKYNTSPLDKLKMDLMYISNYSVLMDVQILFETVKILVQKESTEGFTETKQVEIMNEV